MICKLDGKVWKLDNKKLWFVGNVVNMDVINEKNYYREREREGREWEDGWIKYVMILFNYDVDIEKDIFNY